MNDVHIYSVDFSSFGRAVQLVCEEKQISYEMSLRVNDQEISFKSEQHLQMHPFGKMPVLIHKDRTLAETLPIMRYLDANFAGPALQPEDPWQRAKLDERCQLLATYVNHALVRDYMLELIFPKGEGGKTRIDVMEENKPAAQQALALVRQWLGDSQYLFDNSFSLADALALPSLYYITLLPADFALLEEGDVISRYVEAMRERRASCKKVLVPKD